ncbi:MAG: hypothetical protein D6705_10825 [Deltaproteobacteria bacterium]|nr:MAG: hypothetical protein D6705_10825 [Deltaproteobacteria bacterium]
MLLPATALVGLFGTGAWAVAGPAAAPDANVRGGENAPGDVDAVMREIKGLRSRMLDQVNALKALEQEARERNEKARLACIRKQQEDAAKLLEDVVVPEIQRSLEPGVSVADRKTSRDNLSEAAAKLDGIVELAKACSESKGPTGEGKTQNSVDFERFIPWLDPTAQPPDPPVPPGRDDSRPLSTQSPMM